MTMINPLIRLRSLQCGIHTHMDRKRIKRIEIELSEISERLTSLADTLSASESQLREILYHASYILHQAKNRKERSLPQNEVTKPLSQIRPAGIRDSSLLYSQAVDEL